MPATWTAGLGQDGNSNMTPLNNGFETAQIFFRKANRPKMAEHSGSVTSPIGGGMQFSLITSIVPTLLKCDQRLGIRHQRTRPICQVARLGEGNISTNTNQVTPLSTLKSSVCTPRKTSKPSEHLRRGPKGDLKQQPCGNPLIPKQKLANFNT